MINDSCCTTQIFVQSEALWKENIPPLQATSKYEIMVHSSDLIKALWLLKKDEYIYVPPKCPFSVGNTSTQKRGVENRCTKICWIWFYFFSQRHSIMILKLIKHCFKVESWKETIIVQFFFSFSFYQWAFIVCVEWSCTVTSLAAVFQHYWYLSLSSWNWHRVSE